MTVLADDAARKRIARSLDETLFVEAGAGSGKTKSLVDRVVALIDAGVPMDAIATITFTEKAAAELRQRVRQALERVRDGADTLAPRRERAATALNALDTAAISTLHAFAQRILSEHPIEAALPPAVEVLDEVASEIGFEDRWVRFRDRMLDDPELERTLLLAFAADVRISDLRHLARVFDDNWDLVAQVERVPWGREKPPRPDLTALLSAGDALLARRNECKDGGDLLYAHLTDTVEPHLERLRQAGEDELEVLRLLRNGTKYAYGRGQKGNWLDKASIAQELTALGDQRTAIGAQTAQAVLQRIAAEIAAFTVEAAQERRQHGRLEFHDLLVLARDLLRGDNGEQVRARLAERYRRLLLDEFQDTDPIQIDLAVLIAARGPVSADWSEVEVEPGRLFFVGDPKQSIYRFRRADIALFLQAREVFGHPALALSTNFRTAPGVIAWVNGAFGQLITHEPDSQPDYIPLAAHPDRVDPSTGPAVLTLGVEPHDPALRADDVRDLEADDVAETVLAARDWSVSERQPDGSRSTRAARLGDITILLPARTSLAALERALDERGIPYRAETSSLVYATREVRELMATVSALADPTDQLALVTALRSPVFGCGDDDLHTYRIGHNGRWSYLAGLPEGLHPEGPVPAALRYLRTVHAELPWLTPAEVLDRVARDRRLFELGYAQGRPRDLWRRLRFVIDQARAWSESEGGTLREYVAWARMQASESARVAETILPELDDDSVRIMTIHGSKGLEFPITIVSGMTTASQGRQSGVHVAFPRQGPVALKLGKGLTSEEYEAFKPIDEQMGYHERLRLLYVACTRAEDHLVVSLHRKARKSAGKESARTNAELLAAACADLPAARLEDTAARLQPTPADEPLPVLPPLDVWAAERARVLAASGVPRSIGASDVRLDEQGDPGEVAAGIDKAPRDLELPPWQKGRYGTAIGRAVHAVLQTVDLVTGEGVDEAAAAQAAAEGVFGREADIARLARDALGAPSVRAASGHPRWRETYVATQVGERTLEGYIDLLYRTDDGLVVVDYKTASAGVDLDLRLTAYRGQGGAYAVAIEGATGERVTRVVFVFLTPAGAVERDLPDLAGAKDDVRRAIASASSPAGGLNDH